MGVQPVGSSGDDDVMRDLRRQARITPPLRNDEERFLLEKSARGDRTSQERVVAAHLAMVIKQAEARDDKGLSVPDLVQEGSLGLVEAVRSFAGVSPVRTSVRISTPPIPAASRFC